VLILSVAGNDLSTNITASANVDTKHWIKIVAKDSQSQVADSTYYYVRGETIVEDLPAGVRDGINYVDNQTVTLVIHAPFKNSIYAIGDFNEWQVGPEYKLKRTVTDPQDENTRYWVTLPGLTEGEEYAFQYLIDEELRLADPYTDKILDKWNDPYISNNTYPDLKPYPLTKTEGLVSVLQTGQTPYDWQIENFDPPEAEKLVAYELLLRDFIDAHDFNSLKDTIQYFKRLGITAIELMPVNEFEGNLSWGYNPSFYFAPDKYYGPKDDMKAFIDECHANGIAVIMDMVLNHAYGQNVMAKMYWDDMNNRPAENNPWFNTICPHEPYCWGNDFDHTSLATQAFVDSVNTYWLSEYKIDGFRFDFTQGFTNNSSGWQYDQDRIDIIKRMSDVIWDADPDAYVILEHWTDNSEETVLANYGCMLWANLNYSYNEGTMGYNENGKSNFSWISYKQHGWNVPHVMGYMESHDEERLMAKNLVYGNSSGNYDITDSTTALKRQELAVCFFLTIPGPKMIWQFGELGYDYHINYPGVFGEEDHRLDQKPIRWDYQDDSRRKILFNIYATLNQLRKEHDVFSTDDFSLAVTSALKRINLNHSEMNVTILGNFDVVSGEITPDFQHTGYWYDYYSGDSILVNSTSEKINLSAGEYRIYSDVKLETPQIGLGTSGYLPQNMLSAEVFPNPSFTDFNILFSIDNISNVEISVYNITGAKVKIILSDKLSNGEYLLKWYGKSDFGAKVNPGIYFIEFLIDGQREIVKISVL
ncbi:MAG: T9SS type A sorting domain-containing protein, partial [Bacteroidales bacterium]|nr:T9SS type A sorting domain-containing protein [Bacteroidales bacterium]